MKTGYTFMQGDKGIVFRIIVNELDFASPITAKIVFHRSNGTSVESAASYTGNVVSYTTLGNEFAVPGLVVADVKFYSGDTQRVSTASFLFNVTEDTMDGVGGGTAGYSDELEVLSAAFQETLEDYIEAFGDVGAIHPAGDWDNATAYNVLDVVWYNGASWLAKLASTNQTPADGSAYWQKFVSGSAAEISYDNTSSGLTADDVQEAVDELASEKQDKNLSTPITVDGTSKSTVETALSGINTYADKIDGNVDAVVNVYGAKNLLPNGLTTLVESGVTLTVNADKSITASGTASATTAKTICELTSAQLPADTYIASRGTTDPAVRIGIDGYNNGVWAKSILYQAFTDNDVISVDYNGYNSVRVVIEIISGTDLTIPLTVYPMIRDSRITDPTYVPYAMTNRELTDNSPKTVSGTATTDASGNIALGIAVDKSIICIRKIETTATDIMIMPYVYGTSQWLAHCAHANTSQTVENGTAVSYEITYI